MIIDMHVHVGLLGNRWPHWGRMSDWYQRQLVYKTFLLYARMDPDQVSDITLRNRVIETIDTSGIDKVVCLALDPVYDKAGKRREELSHFWVDNDYIVEEVRTALPTRVLLGASVHPYDPDFQNRVRHYVNNGAVLLKWLPSAQQINLTDPRVVTALTFLSTAGKDGGALPLLLHVGPEYAIPSTDESTASYDYLSWTTTDSIRNWLMSKGRLIKIDGKRIRAILQNAVKDGTIIILAHCGLPYFAPKWLGTLAEHSDFKTIREFLNLNQTRGWSGCFYADVSALCTPFRKTYFEQVRALPSDYMLYGSDFPTPAFELSANRKEHDEDFNAVMRGDVGRVLIPEDNLLDVNLRELRVAFPGHQMFENGASLLRESS